MRHRLGTARGDALSLEKLYRPVHAKGSELAVRLASRTVGSASLSITSQPPQWRRT